MRQITITLLVCLLFCSCEKHELYSILEKESCKYDSTDFVCDLKDLTDFKWDKLYIFSGSVSLDEINTTIGTHFNSWDDIGGYLIYMKDGIVVHSQLAYSSIEYWQTEYVLFSDLNKAMTVSPDDAKFRVEKTAKGSFLLTKY